jgi:hypothetical protein
VHDGDTRSPPFAAGDSVLTGTPTSHHRATTSRAEPHIPHSQKSTRSDGPLGISRRRVQSGASQSGGATRGLSCPPLLIEGCEPSRWLRRRRCRGLWCPYAPLWAGGGRHYLCSAAAVHGRSPRQLGRPSRCRARSARRPSSSRCLEPGRRAGAKGTVLAAPSVAARGRVRPRRTMTARSRFPAAAGVSLQRVMADRFCARVPRCGACWVAGR